MSITSLTDIVNGFADGKGFLLTSAASTSGSPTAPTISSGSMTPSFNFNATGTTVPGTLVGYRRPLVDSLQTYNSGAAGSEQMFPCYLYRFGTIARGTTTLTHTASVTRMRRTVLGTANTPIPLIPMLYFTTAVAGGSTITITMDYVNQDGTSKTGTFTWSFTGAAIAAASGFFLLPNEGTGNATPGDTAVLDVTAMTINWGTATTGAATLYLVEYLDAYGMYAVGIPTVRDQVYGGMNITETAPASPDAGSPTSIYCLMSPSNIGTGTIVSVRAGVNA